MWHGAEAATTFYGTLWNCGLGDLLRWSRYGHGYIVAGRWRGRRGGGPKISPPTGHSKRSPSKGGGILILSVTWRKDTRRVFVRTEHMCHVFLVLQKRKLFRFFQRVMSFRRRLFHGKQSSFYSISSQCPPDSWHLCNNAHFCRKWTQPQFFLRPN